MFSFDFGKGLKPIYRQLCRKQYLLATGRETIPVRFVEKHDGADAHSHQFWEVFMEALDNEAPYEAIWLIPPDTSHEPYDISRARSTTTYQIWENGFQTTCLPPDYGYISVPREKMRPVLDILNLMRRYHVLYGQEAQQLLESFVHVLPLALVTLCEEKVAGRMVQEPVVLPTGDSFAQAKMHIKLNLFDPDLSIAEIARHISISENGLGRIFRKHLGMTAKQYLVFARLRVACQYMRRRDFLLSDIARKSGWHSLSHFCAVFKRVTGMTAGDYRRRSHAGDEEMPAALSVMRDDDYVDAMRLGTI